MRVGSSPTSSSARSSMAPTTARVCHSSVASPQPNSPSWSVRTLTKTQLRIRAWQTCVSIGGDLHDAPRTLVEQADALVDERRHPAVADVRVRDPVGPAVVVLVEDVVERDALDEREVVVGGEVAGVVVRVAEHERLCERAARADLAPGPLKSSNGLDTIAAVADRERLQLGLDRDVGPADHVGVEREHRRLVHGRELLRRRGGVDGLVPGLREVLLRQAPRARRRASMSSSSVAVAAPGELDPSSRPLRASASAVARSRRAPRPRRRRSPRRARPAARTSAARPPSSRTSSPTRRRRRRSPRGTALGAGTRPLDGLPQRAGEVGVPEQRLAAHQRRVAGEARDDRERRRRRRGRPRCTETESSTGRSGLTRLT